MQFDVCLEMVFTERPYAERIAKIAQCGFDDVEFWFHDDIFNGRDCSGGPRTRARSSRRASRPT